MNISTATDTPSIYVACLAAYNAGILHGEWIDATQDVSVIWLEIRNVLASSPVPEAEEWAIHDHDCFGPVFISEYENIDNIHNMACFIDEHGAVGSAVLCNQNGDVEAAQCTMDNYMGCYKSLADYAEETTENCIEIPPSIAYYIDYERMAQDMCSNGDILCVITGYEETHIFLNT